MLGTSTLDIIASSALKLLLYDEQLLVAISPLIVPFELLFSNRVVYSV